MMSLQVRRQQKGRHPETERSEAEKPPYFKPVAIGVDGACEDANLAWRIIADSVPERTK